VVRAFALGWQVSELHEPRSGGRDVPDDDLPPLSAMTPEKRTAVGFNQVRAAVAFFSERIEKAGLEPPDVDEAQRAHEEMQGSQRKTIKSLHDSFAQTLTASDFRLGKAYDLGHALADTCRGNDGVDGFRRHLGTGQVDEMSGWIRDLTSALPPHAGGPVAVSLQRWGDWINGQERPSDEQCEVARKALRNKQGSGWRALLSGEKDGRDMLEPEDYVDAAIEMTRRSGRIMAGFVRCFALVSALVLLLAAGAVALLLMSTDAAQTAAGLGLLAASLGISWKGGAATLGEIASQLEKPLWGAALDEVIARRLTWEGVPTTAGAHRSIRQRARHPLQAGGAKGSGRSRQQGATSRRRRAGWRPTRIRPPANR
jgi:hypothetical protein